MPSTGGLFSEEFVFGRRAGFEDRWAITTRLALSTIRRLNTQLATEGHAEISRFITHPLTYRDENREIVTAGLPVHERGATVERKIHEPLFRKSVSTVRGALTFTSVTKLDEETRCGLRPNTVCSRRRSAQQ
jgi:hypothetical protein